MAAKQIIQQTLGIMLPRIEAIGIARLPDGRRGQTVEVIPEWWTNFDSVFLEQQIGSIRPDAIGQSGAEHQLIEVAVSHFVDSEKREQIRSLNWPAVEITLDPYFRDQWDCESLRAVVIHKTEQKTWIHRPGLSGLQARANAKSDEAAYSPTPREHLSAAEKQSNKTVLRNLGMVVYVTIFPFGITVWSFYHPEVNRIFKDIVRPLGGRWQPKYKNWLLPAVVKPKLLESLETATKR